MNDLIPSLLSNTKTILFNDNISIYDINLGYINGLYAEYNSTTSIKVKKGIIEVLGKYFEFSSDTIHNLTSLATGFDHHYIYVKHSDGTIYDSITEPTKVVQDNGIETWYNGDDRCIGSIPSIDGASTIPYFSIEVICEKSIRYIIGRFTTPAMGTTMSPNGTWQVPNVNDGDVVTPVNANTIQLSMNNTHTGSAIALYATNKEQGDINSNVSEGCFEANEFSNSTHLTNFFPLGESRKIYVAGANGDDNNLATWLFGFGYLR